MQSNRLLSLAILLVLSTSASFAASPTIMGCQILPADNVWNTPITGLPVHQSSNTWVSNIGGGTGIHMDFGSAKWEGKAIGIPYNIISGAKEQKQSFNFLYNDDSDAGPYPINSAFKIEEGTDRHLISLDKDTCKLYEIFNARKEAGVWQGDSGAIFDLNSNAFRPIGLTSADAAGLPILPGLVRYEEVESGEIKHAIRFTVEKTNSFIWPGTHLTSGRPGILTSQTPMGARFRLKADYDISKFDPSVQVILKAMKTYGIINADNGGNWFVSGVPDARWKDNLLASLSTIKGNAFEAVDESCMMVSPDSGQANFSKCNGVGKERVVTAVGAGSNAAAAPVPRIGGCGIFPANNVWNTPVDALPIHPKSSAWIANIGGGTSVHTDFAAGKWEGKEIGIPYNFIDAAKDPKYSFNFLYQEDSDVGPYPFGATSHIEEGSDHHYIALDKNNCKLYEIFNARKEAGVWQGDSGAIFDLNSNAMRPMGLTSADAAGLPILPGLVRYDEVAAGEINHAIRFTAEKTMSYLWPGSHLTSSIPGKLNDYQPPLGARLRLKKDYDISKFDPALQVILKAMKTYGIILADNGANWYLSGVPDARWNDDILSGIDRLRGSAFEVVDQSCMMINANSYQADLSKCGVAPRERDVTPPVVVTPPTASACKYTLSMESKNFSAAGGIDSVTVATTKTGTASCEWAAKSNAAWIPIYVQMLKGEKRVIFAIARNKTGVSRAGSLTIAGQTFNVTQDK